MSSQEIVHQLISLEAQIVYGKPAPQQSQTYAYQPGAHPILISAPHATAHRRDGRLKSEEAFTAAFARLLAQETGAHVLYTRYRSPDDPNWDRHSPYKSQLAQIIHQGQIHFVLDLHGMSNRHQFGIAIGTMNGRSCPRREGAIVRTLLQHQFKATTAGAARRFHAIQWDRFVLNHPLFTGGVANHTITRFVTESLHVSAVQIELCASLRKVDRHGPFANIEGIQHTFQALSQILRLSPTPKQSL